MSPGRLESAAIAALERWLGWAIPERAGWWHTLGSAILGLLALQGVTGVVVALTYCPSPDSALESLRYLDQRVPGGAFVRSLHAWGTTAVLIAMGLHLARVFMMAAFKPPRQWIWVTGMAMALVVLALGFTGYLLPWDAKGYFATRVAGRIAASLPVVGDAVQRMLLGGEDIGSLTLSRFFVMHAVVLPLTLLVLVALHLVLIRVHGIAGDDDGEGSPRRRFFPDHAWKDALAVLIGLLALSAIAAVLPATLDPPPTDVASNYRPRPEWYFLPLFQLLHYFPGPWTFVGAHVIPGISVLTAMLWPWLERSSETRPSRRKLALALSLSAAAAYATLFALAHERAAAPAPSAAVGEPAPLTKPTSSAGEIARGRELFDALRCASCHLARSPLDLAYAGDRLKREWVVAYIRAPSRLSWAREGERPTLRMPQFGLSEPEAASLAAFLDSRHDRMRFPERSVEASLARTASGRTLFAQYQCLGCHRLAGQGKEIGPDLTAVARRFKPGYLLTFLTDPAAVIPGTPMKDLKLWPEEAEDLAAYLESLP